MEYIVEDVYLKTNANFNGEMQEVEIHPIRDRVDHFKMLGSYMLKVISDNNIIPIFIDQQDAEELKELGVPLIDRDTITESEHEIYIQYHSEKLDEWL